MAVKKQRGYFARMTPSPCKTKTDSDPPSATWVLKHILPEKMSKRSTDPQTKPKAATTSGKKPINASELTQTGATLQQGRTQY